MLLGSLCLCHLLSLILTLQGGDEEGKGGEGVQKFIQENIQDLDSSVPGFKVITCTCIIQVCIFMILVYITCIIKRGFKKLFGVKKKGVNEGLDVATAAGRPLTQSPGLLLSCLSFRRGAYSERQRLTSAACYFHEFPY